MLVHFAIEPKCFSIDTNRTRESLHRHHRTIQVWQRHGILVTPSTTEGLAALDARINALPQQVRFEWKKALQALRVRARPRRLDSDGESRELADILSVDPTTIDVACISDETAQVVELSEANPRASEAVHRPEICLFGEFDQSRAFRAALDLSQRPIEKGESVADVWNLRFRPFAEYERHVVIVCRYGFSSSLERRDGKAGLNRILRELRGMSQIESITVYSAQGPGPALNKREIARKLGILEPASSANDLTPEAEQSARSRIKLVLLPDGDFGRVCHGRSLRFGQSVVELDVGTEVFDGDVVVRTCSLSHRPRLDMDRRQENELENVRNKLVFAW